MKKRFLHIFNLFFIVALFFYSCSTEDDTLFEKKGQFINNEGYLPLAPDNTWVYETWTANLAEDGTYEYEGSPTLFQNSIAQIEVDETRNQINYKFGPIGSSFLGGLLGNFDKVTKIGSKYYRNANIDPDGIDNGIEFNLGGSIFLNDSVQVGEMLYSHEDFLELNTLTPARIEYGYKTYVTGKFDRLPDHLTRVKGVDDHLAKFTDIIKVTDSLTIKKVELNVNSVKLDLIITSISEGGSIIHQSSRSPSYGTLDIGIITLLPIFIPFLPIPLPQDGGPRDEAFLITLRTELTDCPMKSVGVINETFSYKYNLIANNTPIYIDTYYAKGVGKIKTVTNVDQILASIGLVDQQDNDNGIIKVSTVNTPIDPNCLTVPNKSALELNLNLILRDINVSIPFTVGVQKDLVQNLKYHATRKTLN